MLGALRYGLHHGGVGRRVHADEAAAAADEHRARRGRLKHHRHAELLHFRGHAGALLAALGRQIAEFRVVLAHKPVEALGDEDLPLPGADRDFHAHHVAEAGGPDAGGQHHFLGGDAAAAGFHALHRAVLDRDPGDGCAVEGFRTFLAGQLREAEAQAHGVELGVAVEVEAGDDLVGDVRLVAEQFVAVPEGHVHAFVLLAFIVGEHGFHVPLVVDQQAEAFGLEFDVAGQLAADFREHVLPDLAELAEVAGRAVVGHGVAVAAAAGAPCVFAALDERHVRAVTGEVAGDGGPYGSAPYDDDFRVFVFVHRSFLWPFSGGRLAGRFPARRGGPPAARPGAGACRGGRGGLPIRGI